MQTLRPTDIAVSGEGYVAIKARYVNEKFFPRTAEVIFIAGSNLDGWEDTEEESYFPIAKINVTGYWNRRILLRNSVVEFQPHCEPPQGGDKYRRLVVG